MINGQPGAGPVKYGNQPIGVSLGSGYQRYFSGLSTAEQNAQIAAMRAAGITWVRMDVDWDAVQPSETSSFDWDYPMLTVRPMLAAGMNVLPILLWSPTWARAVGNNPAVPGDPFPTISPTAFATFCGAAAAQFGPLGVSAFELWNEPNLDKGGANSPLGLGYLSPVGYASLAVAAYKAIHSQYSGKSGGAPTPTVVGGALAGWPRLDWPAQPRSGASWQAVAAGAPSATITCSSAVSSDLYKLVAGSAVSVSTSGGTNGLWPSGTYISQVTSSGYVVSPPPWLPQFPAVNASGSGTTFGLETGYPPDVFVAQAYAAAAGLPMFDALSLHPYAWPGFGAFRYVDSGSWALVPAVRQIMVANGDGAKPIWFSEIGMPSGQSFGSWPATTATSGQLTVTGDANAEEVGYLAGVAGLPLGTYVAAVNPGTSWTLLPPTGLTVNQTLTPGSSINTLSIIVASTVDVPPVEGGAVSTVHPSDTITIPSGTTLTVWFGNGNGYDGDTDNGYAMPPMTVTTTAAATITPSPPNMPASTATLHIESVTVPAALNSVIPPFPAGGVIQCSANLGQTWGVSVPEATRAVLNILAPGVYSPWAIGPLTQSPSAISSEDQQATNIPYSFQFVASEPWPYVGPMFIYCWSDASFSNNAGPFGLTRADGSAKPALAKLTAIAQTGGLSPGIALPGYTT